MDKLLQEGPPILILCVVIALVVRRLPRVDVGHTDAFRRRRLMNWLPLGLTYAFLYMGRYNIVELMKLDIITPRQFGDIDGIGAIVYGVSFLVNGPLTDKFGGRRAILLAAGGAAVCNVGMGIMIAAGSVDITLLTLLFALNMYFQSFGAVAIVKVNSSWFHLRERGTFGGIFGILISLGLYLAFDWAPKIALLTSIEWLFLAPGLLLALFWAISFALVRDTPSGAGLPDFDVADASSGQSDAPESAVAVIKRMLFNRIILLIAVIELCSGFLRQGILKWYRNFASGVSANDSYIYEHWGMVSCIAGITGGMFAGLISDHIFGSRRAPVASVLYAIMLVGAIMIVPFLAWEKYAVSVIIAVMAMAIIGVHGMLSGVASQDFGGRRNAGVATGLIDGFVYVGSAMQSFVYGSLLPQKNTVEAKDIDNWYGWPIAMIPMALIGLVLALRLWNARVHPKTVIVQPASPISKEPDR